MAKYIKITGSGASGTGIAVLNDSGKVRYLDSMAPTSYWRDSMNTTPFVPTLMCGNNTNGVAVSDGASIKYLTALGNAQANWKTLAPVNAKIVGVTGDYVNGFAVLDDSSIVHTLGAIDSKTLWKQGPLLPFDSQKPATLIVGDNKGGILVVGGDDGNEIAKSGTDCCSWTPVASAPITIELIAGNMASGFIAYGEGQLLTLDAAKGVWTALPRLTFGITALGGNPKDGVAVLLKDADVVAYCVDPTKGPWSIARVADVA